MSGEDGPWLGPPTTEHRCTGIPPASGPPTSEGPGGLSQGPVGHRGLLRPLEAAELPPRAAVAARGSAATGLLHVPAAPTPGRRTPRGAPGHRSDFRKTHLGAFPEKSTHGPTGHTPPRTSITVLPCGAWGRRAVDSTGQGGGRGGVKCPMRPPRAAGQRTSDGHRPPRALDPPRPLALSLPCLLSLTYLPHRCLAVPRWPARTGTGPISEKLILVRFPKSRLTATQSIGHPVPAGPPPRRPTPTPTPRPTLYLRVTLHPRGTDLISEKLISMGFPKGRLAAISNLANTLPATYPIPASYPTPPISPAPTPTQRPTLYLQSRLHQHPHRGLPYTCELPYTSGARTCFPKNSLVWGFRKVDSRPYPTSPTPTLRPTLHLQSRQHQHPPYDPPYTSHLASTNTHPAAYPTPANLPAPTPPPPLTLYLRVTLHLQSRQHHQPPYGLPCASHPATHTYLCPPILHNTITYPTPSRPGPGFSKTRLPGPCERSTHDHISLLANTNPAAYPTPPLSPAPTPSPPLTLHLRATLHLQRAVRVRVRRG